MRAAEDWARLQSLPVVYLSSGAERQAAHSFYRGLGYLELKMQVAFTRRLDSQHPAA